MEMQEFYEGNSFDAYTFFGAHVQENGVIFRTYAPGAEKVSLFGDFNGWQEEEMQKDGAVYSLFIPEAYPGMMYKYVIYSSSCGRVEHCDPYGFGMELRPKFASYIVNLETYCFHDEDWMSGRDKNYNRPMQIYELHLGSWKKKGEHWYQYDEIADALIWYLKENHFTHVEFLPLNEHPADCSWGYQSTGFFSPTSRYGTAIQFMQLVDRCHQAGIGVIMDFVPVHFAMDGYGLRLYDGSPLYEYPESDVHMSEWGTYNFIHSRGEVCSFLQSAANFWLSVFHFDGLRMDAISRAIYWQGDPKRGVIDCTVNFLKRMNYGLHKLHPTAMLIAEDSTSFLKITAPVEYDGLGFDYKWNLGWMNDTLAYFRTPPDERPAHYNKLLFSMEYFYQELFLLPFSHDENVHGKATIIQKMWGDYTVKFPQCRALYLYMLAHPGKKLNFMGGEFAQFREWDENRAQDWEILQFPLHNSFLQYIRKLNQLYQQHPALYTGEYDPRCFSWLIADAPLQSVYVFTRKSCGERMVCAFNFSDQIQEIEFPENNPLYEIIASDLTEFGGGRSGLEQIHPRIRNGKRTIGMILSPFSGRLFIAE